MKPNTIQRYLSTVFSCLLFFLPIKPSHAEDINIITAVNVGDAGIEVHLQSSRPFPVRAMPPVLHIGSESFNRSFRPEDGDLKSLVFLLSTKEYAHFRGGEPVRVVYGRGVSPREQWDFGTLHK
jgi:hypothetical protein